jgi:hypothetical protein
MAVTARSQAVTIRSPNAQQAGGTARPGDRRPPETGRSSTWRSGLRQPSGALSGYRPGRNARDPLGCP